MAAWRTQTFSNAPQAAIAVGSGDWLGIKDMKSIINTSQSERARFGKLRSGQIAPPSASQPETNCQKLAHLNLTAQIFARPTNPVKSQTNLDA
jgi:hypothetical protein